MSTLSDRAVAEITKTFNSMTGTTVTVAEYIEWAFSGSGEWGGDVCGCTDDRCKDGFHHEPHEPCGCLDHLLDEFHDELCDAYNAKEKAK